MPVNVSFPFPVLVIVGAELCVIAALISRSFSAVPSATANVTPPKSERKFIRPAISAGAVALVIEMLVTPHSK